MKKLIPGLLVLLGACSSQWPAGSYSDLPTAADDPAIRAALIDCINEVVPPNAKIHLPGDTGRLSIMLPVMLSNTGIEVDEKGLPVSYVIASTGTSSAAKQAEGAFIRVIAPKGTCSQYLSRDAEGALHPAGPIMVATQ